jgi:exosome complex RNA-binding protein Rrp42 (RNase PH superfamily)
MVWQIISHLSLVALVMYLLTFFLFHAIVFNVHFPNSSQGDKQDRRAALVQRLERLLISREATGSGPSLLLDLSQLIITAGEAMWVLYVDIVPLAEDGDLLSPILYLLHRLFLDFTLPKVVYDAEVGIVTQLAPSGGLPLSFTPILPLTLKLVPTSSLPSLINSRTPPLMP